MAIVQMAHFLEGAHTQQQRCLGDGRNPGIADELVPTATASVMFAHFAFVHNQTFHL
jgi:hypothetical protein